MVYKAHRKGENFGNLDNRVTDSVSGSWARVSCVEDDDHIIGFEAVYWDCETVGRFLSIRDAYGDEIYYVIADGSRVAIDLLESPLTVRLPLEYLTNISGSIILVWGKFV